MNIIELRRLRAFIALAEEGHVTRAAERLGMQQPLKKCTKSKLFEQGTRMIGLDFISKLASFQRQFRQPDYAVIIRKIPFVS